MPIQSSISKNIPLRFFALTLTSLFVVSASAALAAFKHPPITAVTLFEFSGTADEPAWNAVNDGVMGGVSRGGAKLIGGSLHFRGVLSLENNGGFSSIRSGGPTRDLSAAKAIVLRVKGDGRTYRLQLATNAEFRRSRISYQAEFPTKRGEWTEVIVPLASSSHSSAGRSLRART
jgi:monofunctional biosynthetic peptidoglycan transglycosylase